MTQTPFQLIGKLSVAQRVYLEQSAQQPMVFPSHWLAERGLVALRHPDGWTITERGREYLKWLEEVREKG